MERQVNYAMVGLFVILLGAVWLAISLWLALGDFGTNYTRYHVFMNESVSGLNLDAPVKYRGVEIGRVRDIDLNPLVPGQVQLTLDIEADVPIREDTIAVLTVQGVTGIAFVDLTGGSLESPLLQAGDDQPYPVIKTGPSFFFRLDQSGSELISNLNVLARSFAELLDDESKQAIKQAILNIRDITATVADQKTELASSMASVPALLVQIDETARAFEQMAGKVAVTSDSINLYVNKSGTGVQQFSQQTLPEFGALISELRRLADTMQGLVQKLEDDPRVLIYGRDLEVPGPGE
jgi:phospholipid/cholesterol/gamma-HCH transport system substrate-binding protein